MRLLVLKNAIEATIWLVAWDVIDFIAYSVYERGKSTLGKRSLPTDERPRPHRSS